MVRPTAFMTDDERALRRAVDRVLQTLCTQEPEWQANWQLRLVHAGVPDAARAGLQRLLRFLLRNMDVALDSESTLTESVLQELRQIAVPFTAAELCLLTAYIEEICSTQLWQATEGKGMDTLHRWVHIVCTELAQAALPHGYGATSVLQGRDAWDTPFVRWLNAVCPTGSWHWFAVIQSGPELSILEFATYQRAERRWLAAAGQDLADEIRREHEREGD
ncbi:hypothetical protein GCM10025857_34380 [Alicyclobacillus contaminans]|nr:hypothetical protein GCM10025857_34380 [Alicyclobacillus contaminans]